jgi:hypothetical protein
MILLNKVVGRIGTQKYLESEIIPNGSTSKIVEVLRPEEIVKKIDLTGLPVTISHLNYKNNIVGRVLSSRYGNGLIYADLEVKDMYRKYVKGFSIGYQAKAQKVGKDSYVFIYLNPNHVALTSTPRCGTECKI